MAPLEVEAVARAMVRRLVEEGARAVVLAGSAVRGDAGPESDLDLYAFGPRSGYLLERHGGRLVSITWRSPEAERAAFLEPSKAGAVIPAWRGARILIDPDEIAADIKAQADSWSWDAIGGERLDRYVAEEITGLAEEVHKLVNALRDGRRWTAAVQRNILALHLAPVLSVHLRLHYETENRLWDMVANELGADWREAQTVAFEELFEASCHAALQLYRLAASATRNTLDAGQREVVEYACSLTP